MGAISFINKYFFGIGIPFLLMGAGIFYCIRLKFFHFLHPIKVLRSFKSERSGGVSSLKAMMLALAGTLGVGNMVGVASAIALGGFGAVFWMWVSALIAMILKYAEIVLAMLYRKYDEGGRPYGAAMYYIRACFKGRLGAVLAGILRGSTGILALTEKLVPLMTLGFTVISVAVIVMRPSDALAAIEKIFSNAFSFQSGAAGVSGFLLSGAIRYGTMRGILSNEAGCGTAPAAHAVSSCREPARQGTWGIFEVFVDTILLCALTAIVIIIGYDAIDPSGDFMMMTVAAYESVIGRAAGYFLAIAVMLFGLATVLCWAHYGEVGVNYFSRRAGIRRAYKLIYSLCVFLGALVSTDVLWESADLSIGTMSAINICALLLMSGRVKRETEEYFGRS